MKHYMYMRRKPQLSQCKHSGLLRVETTRQVRSSVKVLLTGRIRLQWCGALFLPEGRTVNKKYYLEVVRRLREAMRKKRLELWENPS